LVFDNKIWALSKKKLTVIIVLCYLYFGFVLTFVHVI